MSFYTKHRAWWNGALFALLLLVGLGAAQGASAEQFFINGSFHSDGLTSITASQRDSGVHSRVFVEDAWWDGLTATERNQVQAGIDEAIDVFDTVVYPGLRDFYGEENRPGIDGDPLVALLFADLSSNIGGYFREGDQVSQEQNEESNEREMVHLNVSLLQNTQRLPAFLAHEFHHLINFNQKNIEQGLQEEIWLNEARSEYAPTVLGFDDDWEGSHLQSRINAYLQTPIESLLEWTGNDHDYGHVSLFAQYIAEQFSADTLARTIESGVGIASINDAVIKAGGDRTFSQLFTDWVLANYLNAPDAPRWGYQRAGLARIRVAPTDQAVLRSPSTVTMEHALKDWSAHWLRFSAGGSANGPTFRLTFEQNDAARNFIVPYIIERSDGTAAVQSMALQNGSGTATVDGFGTDVRAVTIVPTLQEATSLSTEPAGIAQYSLVATRQDANALMVDTVTPSSVSAEGGATVFVRGSGFTDNARVWVDDTMIVPTVDSEQVLSFVAPAHTAGTATVRVTLPDGQEAELIDALTYTGEAGESDGGTGDVPAFVQEGDLIRERGDIDIYIVKFINGKRFKRLILNPDVFNSYEHFDWNSVEEVEPGVTDLFETSTIVRAVDDDRVFQLFPDGDEGTKRWLNISAETFTNSGRDWDSIYLINSFERELYVEGEPITE